MLVRLLSHPRLHPSLSPGGVVERDKTQGSLEQRPLRIRRLSEDDSRFLHLTPLPRCTNLFPRWLLGRQQRTIHHGANWRSVVLRYAHALLSDRPRRLQGDMPAVSDHISAPVPWRLPRAWTFF